MNSSLNINIFLQNKIEPVNIIIKDSFENSFKIFKDILGLNNNEINYYKIKTNNLEFYFNPENIALLYIVDSNLLYKYSFEFILYNKNIPIEVKIPILNKIDMICINENNFNNYTFIKDKKTIIFTNDISGFLIKKKTNSKNENTINNKDNKHNTNKDLKDDFKFEIIKSEIGENNDNNK